MARAVVLLFLIVTVVAINAYPRSDGRCGQNEEYTNCGSSCEPSCVDPQPRACTLACVLGCQCVAGHVRNAQNKCVPLYSC